MENFKFFFDTADGGYIEDKWEQYKLVVDPRRVLGITTNPNAFSKEDLNSLDGWKKRTTELCRVVTKIKSGSGGHVHVQMPSSSMSKDEVFDWIKMVSGWTDGFTKISLKIPPKREYLSLVSEISNGYFVDVNVTGVADCTTALGCLTRPVKYVSIIPGRMEEVGLPAKDHVHTVMNARSPGSKWNLITGSMRTLSGLRWCIEAGTVPTIGKRVFDLITPENQEEIFSWSSHAPEGFSHELVGPNAETSLLSTQFFEQMDTLGTQVYHDFKNR